VTERLQHWDRHLLDAVEAARERQFVWGEHDCVTFAAACVTAITGADPLANLPRWSNATTARRAVEAVGGLDAALTERFGAAVPPAYAQRGDLGLMYADRSPVTGATLAVCLGEWWVAPADTGLGRVRLDAIEAAWRVGR
jgi:hypothetical protein